MGLEVGVLAEVCRNCSIRRICQVDIADNNEHKHQELAQGDPSNGLMKIAMDISKSLFRILAAEGVKFDTGLMQTLLVRYQRMAENSINRYHADAMINGLVFDRHEEETAVETFSQALRMATDEFFADPLGTPPIPNWMRVSAASPGFLDDLRESVDVDKKHWLASAKCQSGLRAPSCTGRVREQKNNGLYSKRTGPLSRSD